MSLFKEERMHESLFDYQLTIDKQTTKISISKEESMHESLFY